MTEEHDSLFDDGYAILDEREDEAENENALITVTSLPQIQENLRALRERWDRYEADANAMVCTEETVQAVKAIRTEMRKEFDEAEAQRKAAKAAYMAPWEAVEATYKECVSDAFKAADGALKGKVNEFETALKDACKAELTEYFDELCRANGINFLRLEAALAIGGMKISLTDAKSASQKKLKKGLADVVAKIAAGIQQIGAMPEEDIPEIMAEFKQRLDVGDAVAVVNARKMRVKAEREAEEARRAAQDRRDAAIAKAEACMPAEEVKEPVRASQRLYRITFTINCTREQGLKVREFLKQEGIQYE